MATSSDAAGQRAAPVAARRTTRAATALAVALVPVVTLVLPAGAAVPGRGDRLGVAAVPAPPGTVLDYTLRVGLPGPLAREAVFAAGPHQLLVVAGDSGSGSPASSAVDSFDTSNGHLQQLGTMGAPLVESAKVDLGGTDLLFGGSAGEPSAAGSPAASAHVVAIARMAPAKGRPSQLEGKVVASLPSGRAGAGAAVLDGRAYLAGGYAGAGSETTSIGSVLATSDGRHFSTVASLLQAVRYPAVVADGAEVLVIGGEVVHAGVPVASGEVQAVVPSPAGVAAKSLATHKAGSPAKPAATVRIVAQLPEPVCGAEAWVVAGRLYVAGGDSDLSSTGSGVVTSGSIWVYDGKRRVFRLAGNLSVPVADAGVAVIGDVAYLVGGEDQGSAVTTVQEVVPVR